MINVGEELKAHRTKANLSQQALADCIKTTQQSISRWENNEVELPLSICIALADLYHISLDELVGREIK